MGSQVRFRMWASLDEDPSGLKTVNFHADVLNVKKEDDTVRLVRERLGAGFELTPYQPVVSRIELNSSIKAIFSNMGSELSALESPLALDSSNYLLSQCAETVQTDQVLNAFSKVPFHPIISVDEL